MRRIKKQEVQKAINTRVQLPNSVVRFIETRRRQRIAELTRRDEIFEALLPTRDEVERLDTIYGKVFEKLGIGAEMKQLKALLREQQQRRTKILTTLMQSRIGSDSRSEQ